MKNFLVFASGHYYPGGGLEDFISDYDSLEAAVTAVKELRGDYYDWAQILALDTRGRADFEFLNGEWRKWERAKVI